MEWKSTVAVSIANSHVKTFPPKKHHASARLQADHLRWHIRGVFFLRRLPRLEIRLWSLRPRAILDEQEGRSWSLALVLLERGQDGRQVRICISLRLQTSIQVRRQIAEEIRHRRLRRRANTFAMIQNNQKKKLTKVADAVDFSAKT